MLFSWKAIDHIRVYFGSQNEKLRSIKLKLCLFSSKLGKNSFGTKFARIFHFLFYLYYGHVFLKEHEKCSYFCRQYSWLMTFFLLILSILKICVNTVVICKFGYVAFFLDLFTIDDICAVNTDVIASFENNSWNLESCQIHTYTHRDEKFYHY